MSPTSSEADVPISQMVNHPLVSGNPSNLSSGCINVCPPVSGACAGPHALASGSPCPSFQASSAFCLRLPLQPAHPAHPNAHHPGCSTIALQNVAICQEITISFQR